MTRKSQRPPRQSRAASPSKPAAGKRRSVWLEPEVYQELVRLAKTEERSISFLMRRFIKQGIQQMVSTKTNRLR